MPLAAITPVLNDLLHKGGSSSPPSSRNQSQQRASNVNDSSNVSEYLSRGSLVVQSTIVPSPLSLSSFDNVSSI